MLFFNDSQLLRAFYVLAAVLMASASNSSSSDIGPYGLNNHKCTQNFYSIDVNSTNIKFVNIDQTNNNQTVVTALALLYSLSPPNFTEQFTDGTFEFSATYNISGTLCVPIKGAKPDSAIQILIHGISSDSFYWDFDFTPDYSYIRHAASHGYTTFRYDRLGTGLSQTPVNGFNEVQASTEVAILTEFVKLLKNTNSIGGKKWSRVVGIGHSYGAIQTQQVTVANPDLLDGAVLQGYSANQTFFPNIIEAFGISIARTIPDLPQLKNKPPAWMASATPATNQIPYWYFPFYASGAFNLARTNEQAVTLGTFFSVASTGGVATAYKKPVQFLMGDKDFIFAGGNAYAGPDGQTIPAASAALLYPNAHNEVYIVANTGHLTNQHFSAPEVHEATLDFIIRNGL